MSVVEELVAAIDADPNDEASQLVIADYLQADGDPRGDLIVLDHADRCGLLDDPVALDQLLLLAAQYSFPRAAPDDPLLPFARRSRQPTQYVLRREDLVYTVDLEDGPQWPNYRLRLRISAVDADEDDTHHYAFQLKLEVPWSETDEDIVLTLLSDVIRAATPFDGLRFPYGTMSLPQYPGSPLRCYLLPIEFLRTHDFLRNQLGLAARDYHRWQAIWTRLRAIQPR